MGTVGSERAASAAGPDDDLALASGENPPAERLGPEPGQPGQVAGDDDDVVQSDRHSLSICGHPPLTGVMVRS